MSRVQKMQSQRESEQGAIERRASERVASERQASERARGRASEGLSDRATRPKVEMAISWAPRSADMIVSPFDLKLAGETQAHLPRPVETPTKTNKQIKNTNMKT